MFFGREDELEVELFPTETSNGRKDLFVYLNFRETLRIVVES